MPYKQPTREEVKQLAARLRDPAFLREQRQRLRELRERLEEAWRATPPERRPRGLR